MAVTGRETGGQILLSGIFAALEHAWRQPLQFRGLEPKPLDEEARAELADEYTAAVSLEWEESGLAVCLLLSSADAAYITQAVQPRQENVQSYHTGVLAVLRQWAEAMGSAFITRVGWPESLSHGSAYALRFTYGVQGGWTSDGALVYSQALEDETPMGGEIEEVPQAGIWNVADDEATERLPHNLEMVLDLQLTATARLAGVDMRLEDVLNLRAGSVVDLGRRVDEPVELLVNGKLVARAEVVVQDGTLALRVTEVISPRARLDSLG